MPALLSGLPATASILTIGVGILILLDWIFDIELPKRVVPGLVAMNPATAVCFVMAGLALAMSIPETRSAPWQRVAALLSAVVLLVAIAKLIGIAAAWQPNVDEWLFASKLAVACSSSW